MVLTWHHDDSNPNPISNDHCSVPDPNITTPRIDSSDLMCRCYICVGLACQMVTEVAHPRPVTSDKRKRLTYAAG